MDYLGSIEASGGEELSLIREMSRRLEALRRYDQCFSEADWRPQREPGRQESSKTPRSKPSTQGGPKPIGRSPWHAKGDES